MFCFFFVLISDPLSAVLLVAKRSQIIADRINRRPPLIHPIVTGANIVAVDFDKATSKVYWADSSEKKILSAYQNGTGWQEVRKNKGTLEEWKQSGTIGKCDLTATAKKGPGNKVMTFFLGL